MPLLDLPFKAFQLRIMATYVFECIFEQDIPACFKGGF